jgi:hypothetical protein
MVAVHLLLTQAVRKRRSGRNIRKVCVILAIGNLLKL